MRNFNVNGKLHFGDSHEEAAIDYAWDNLHDAMVPPSEGMNEDEFCMLVQEKDGLGNRVGDSRLFKIEFTVSVDLTESKVKQ